MQKPPIVSRGTLLSPLLKAALAALFGGIWAAKQLLGYSPRLGWISVPPDVPVTVLVVGALTIWLWREKTQHERALGSVPTRIHVTGIRGKTTTTRLIGYALRQSGRRVVTKTTGKAARIIDPNGQEMAVDRQGGKRYLPTITEQVRILDRAKKERVDAVVLECMAIRPDLIAAERKIVKPTISVITNVRTDHLDVLGPSLADVARNLCQVIPEDGIVITAERRHLGIIRQEAGKKRAQVIVARDDDVLESWTSEFPYLNFRENISIALKAAESLGVDRETAFRGMLNAPADVGMVEVLRLEGGRVELISAFGVNDVESTVELYELFSERGLLSRRPVYCLFHARADRISRSVDFARGIEGLGFERLFVMGEATSAFTSQLNPGLRGNGSVVDLGRPQLQKITQMIDGLPVSSVIFGCGNRVGLEEILDALRQQSLKVASEIQSVKEEVVASVTV